MPGTSQPTPTAGSCDATGAEHVVQRAGVDDLDGIADALASAFADYAWTRWIVDQEDHVARLRRLHELTAGRVGLPHGEVWVVRCPAADRAAGASVTAASVAGAVVALRPDRPVPTDVWREMASEEEVLLGSRAAAARDAEDATGHLRPPGALVDVATIGVRPDHWRRGLASHLLRPVLDLARELDAPAYLETSSTGNVALYERNGFRVVGEATVPGGGPRVWAMLS